MTISSPHPVLPPLLAFQSNALALLEQTKSLVTVMDENRLIEIKDAGAFNGYTVINLTPEMEQKRIPRGATIFVAPQINSEENQIESSNPDQPNKPNKLIGLHPDFFIPNQEPKEALAALLSVLQSAKPQSIHIFIRKKGDFAKHLGAKPGAVMSLKDFRKKLGEISQVNNLKTRLYKSALRLYNWSQEPYRQNTAQQHTTQNTAPNTTQSAAQNTTVSQEKTCLADSPKTAPECNKPIAASSNNPFETTAASEKAPKPLQTDTQDSDEKGPIQPDYAALAAANHTICVPTAGTNAPPGTVLCKRITTIETFSPAPQTGASASPIGPLHVPLDSKKNKNVDKIVEFLRKRPQSPSQDPKPETLHSLPG